MLEKDPKKPQTVYDLYVEGFAFLMAKLAMWANLILELVRLTLKSDCNLEEVSRLFTNGKPMFVIPIKTNPEFITDDNQRITAKTLKNLNDIAYHLIENSINDNLRKFIVTINDKKVSKTINITYVLQGMDNFDAFTEYDIKTKTIRIHLLDKATGIGFELDSRTNKWQLICDPLNYNVSKIEELSESFSQHLTSLS